MKDVLRLKAGGHRVIILSIAAALVPSGIAFYSLANIQTAEQSQSNSPTPSTPTVTGIAALGRLEPEGEVIHLSATPTPEGARVAELLVKENDWVKSGQVIAILDSRNRLQAALEKAQEQVKVARARLAQVEAGAKAGEIDAQKATIARLNAQRQGQKETQGATIARLKAQLQGEIAAQQATLARLKAQLQGEIAAQEATIARIKADVSNARKEFERYQLLYQEGAISVSLLDSKRLTLDTASEQLKEAQANLNKIVATSQQQLIEQQATLNKISSAGGKQIEEATATRVETEETLQQQIEEAKATLEQISEVRSVDVTAAKAEIDSALATVKQAQSDLELAYVRSPVAGQILKIHARPGEIVGERGIAELGQTNQMYVVAEVYETDITKVRVGQRATVTSLAFASKLRGTVTQIGAQIGKKNIFNPDPTADLDVRVVEVKIRLELADSKQVAGLTNLQLDVVIEL
jgi:HlyD family secretion protein